MKRFRWKPLLVFVFILVSCSSDDHQWNVIKLDSENLSIFRTPHTDPVIDTKTEGKVNVYERIMDFRSGEYYFKIVGTSKMLRTAESVKFTYEFDVLYGDYRFRAISLWCVVFKLEKDPITDLPYHVSLLGRYKLGPNEGLTVNGEVFAGGQEGLYNVLSGDNMVVSVPLETPLTDRIVLLTKLDGINEANEDIGDLERMMGKGFEFTYADHHAQ